MEKSDGGASVRVVVRVRPPDKTQSACDALRIGPDGRRVTITHAPAAEDDGGGVPRQRNVTTKSYTFDAVLSPHASQTDIYETAGIQGLVEAASQGFHSTILAYGQTGSGKTYTMEGFRYVPRAHGPPVADFDGTPTERLGVVPRAVHALFDSLKSNPERRSLIKCSFVQIYKEQAYDLLNPATIAAATQGPKPSPQQLRGSPGLPGAVAGALRMRWSKQDDFYLENLFKVEVASPDEALALFRGGVLNKVMASHKLNASSSRSHCLFTLYIDSHPMSSPSEIISSRLTLVDLAGSERAAAVGATEGKLRDENVAINKSLFTLRQVITSLAASSSSSEGSDQKPPSRQQSRTLSTQKHAPLPSQPQLTHVPYRDSKLTSLLKNSLGGNSLTLMIACIAPSDDYVEENISTLDYASRAARITNKVALNEDPKTRIIRELREEVAFLRQQLIAAGTGAGGGESTEGSSSLPLVRSPSNPLKQSQLVMSAMNQPTASSDSIDGGPSETAGSHLSAESDDMRKKLLESSQHDIGIIVGKCLQFYSLVQQLTSTNQQLRRAYGAASQGSEQLRIDNDSLMLENAGLRDRLSFIEGMAGMPETTPQPAGGKRLSLNTNAGASSSLDVPPGSSGSVVNPSNVFTPGAAALIELQELRRENQLLRDKLKMTLEDRPDFDLLSHGNASPTKFRGKNSIQQPGGGGKPLQRGGGRGAVQTSSISNPFTPVALRNMSSAAPGGGGGGVGMSVASLRDMLASSSSSQAPTSSEPEASNEGGAKPQHAIASQGSLSSMTLQPWSGSGVLSSHQDDSGAMQKLTALMSQRNALARARILGPASPSPAGEVNTAAAPPDSPRLGV